MMQISVFIYIIFLYLFCMTSFRTFCASDYKLVYGSDTVLCLKNFICISLCIMDFYVHVLKTLILHVVCTTRISNFYSVLKQWFNFMHFYLLYIYNEATLY
jgi:hypothetical protein